LRHVEKPEALKGHHPHDYHDSMDWGRSQKPWCFIPPKSGVVLDLFSHFGDIQKWIMGVFRMEFPVCGFFFGNSSPQLFPLGHPTSMVSVAGSKSLKTLKRWSGVRVHSVSWLPATEVGETVEQ
jgi:hypothetical protein